MSPLQIPYDDNCLAHTADYGAFDDWGEGYYDREPAEYPHLFGLDSEFALPAC